MRPAADEHGRPCQLRLNGAAYAFLKRQPYILRP